VLSSIRPVGRALASVAHSMNIVRSTVIPCHAAKVLEKRFGSNLQLMLKEVIIHQPDCTGGFLLDYLSGLENYVLTDVAVAGLLLPVANV
ncbi:hypothetical protein DFQ26_004544, partial [Actinomortierella ambigua]